MAGRFGVDGLIASVPGIARKQPDTGLFAQTPPVCAELIEQYGAEHHVAVFATLTALDVNHHPLTINVADLQAR
jgi:hypothetical protein